MKHKVTQIRDLGIVLKDLEPCIKNPKSLYDGREFKSFALRPREVLANWLICAVGNANTESGELTFATDPMGGDGLIIDSNSGKYMFTEHVFIPNNSANSATSVDSLIADSVNHKAKKGKAYAEGQTLIVFNDAKGKWHPDKVGKMINGVHHFNQVFVVGLEEYHGADYKYNVAEIQTRESPVCRVSINVEFTIWTVQPVV